MADPNSTKCFSGVLRRFLCCGGLPTHPSEQFSIESKTGSKQVDHHLRRQEKYDDEPKLKLAESSPGLVARLMGLDSLPEHIIKPKHCTLASYFRSKSVNSIDFLAQLDYLSPSQARHRRVRTALSFNEVPSFDLENPKHDFNVNVLHFDEEESRRKDSGAKFQELKKPDQVRQRYSNNKVKVKQHEVVKKFCKKLEDKPKRSVLYVKKKNNNVRKTNLELKERRAAKSRYSKKKNNPRNSSSSSSSSSVLNDVKDYQMHQDQPIATPTVVASSPGEHDQEEKVKEESLKMLGRICNLTADDLRECCWVPSHRVLKFEDLEEICVHYGQQILELLMKQVVDELVLIHWRKQIVNNY